MAADLEAPMSDSPPKPKRRRWRWLAVSLLLLCLIGVTAWWNWSQPDSRFVGTWRVGTAVTWTLTLDGRMLQIVDGRPIHILNWTVGGDAFQMFPKREHWLSSAQFAIGQIVKGKSPTFSQRWRIVAVSPDSIEFDPKWSGRPSESLRLTRQTGLPPFTTSERAPLSRPNAQ